MNELRKYILKTKYKKSVDCIIQKFDRTGITNLDRLKNAPIYGHPCVGVDIYDLSKEIRDVAKDWVEPVSKKKMEEKLDE